MRRKSEFRERLAYYAMGVAIGLMLLGFFALMRQRSAQGAARPADAAGSTQPAMPAR